MKALKRQLDVLTALSNSTRVIPCSEQADNVCIEEMLNNLLI